MWLRSFKMVLSCISNIRKLVFCRSSIADCNFDFNLDIAWRAEMNFQIKSYKELQCFINNLEDCWCRECGKITWHLKIGYKGENKCLLCEEKSDDKCKKHKIKMMVDLGGVMFCKKCLKEGAKRFENKYGKNKI